MGIDDQIHGATSLVTVVHEGGTANGSGFFYALSTPEEKGPHPAGTLIWTKLERIWLISNKHVLCPNHEKGAGPPKIISVHVRERRETAIEWEELKFFARRTRDLLRFHPDPAVDVASLDVTEQIHKLPFASRNFFFFTIGAHHFPERRGLNIEVGSDVLVIGYPRAFYDKLNKFPIVKTGIIASRWGAPFEGKRHCLVDARLFPGSSGSLVISKPTHYASDESGPAHFANKRYCLIGVYSGEVGVLHKPVETPDGLLLRKETFDLGAVWYPETITETIAQENSPFPRP